MFSPAAQRAVQSAQFLSRLSWHMAFTRTLQTTWKHNVSGHCYRQRRNRKKPFCESKRRCEEMPGENPLETLSNHKSPQHTQTYVTCSEKAEFEPQWPCLVSQDIHTLCIDVTKETSQRHCRSSDKERTTVCVCVYMCLVCFVGSAFLLWFYTDFFRFSHVTLRKLHKREIKKR